ncbi:MAG: tetratricopeptide repeat protein [Rhodothermales bacterium]|nr:tetratricopeptide repeat protein [Rhodothermales bacterium]
MWPRLLLGLLLPSLLLSACGRERAREALAAGNVALNRLELDAASGHYTEALRLDPGLAEAHLKRGQIRWMQRRFEPAIEDLDRALALDPDLGWAHFFRGASLFALDRLEEALPALAFAAASDDLPPADRARAHRMRGIVFMNVERYEDGAEALSAAVALQPRHAIHYFERGLLYAALSRNRDAAADLERFLHLDSTTSTAVAHARHVLDSLRAAGR